MRTPILLILALLAPLLACSSPEPERPSAPSAAPPAAEPPFTGAADTDAGITVVPEPTTPTLDPLQGCIDLDGDGYGVGLGCTALDCNDDNPHFNAVCPDCAEGPGAGCPCAGDAPVACYDGDPALIGAGVCVAGERLCEDGVWSTCVGQVVEAEETCDGVDNDCDGELDEGVIGECGDCDPDCHVIAIGAETETPFAPAPDVSHALTLTPDGWLTLDETQGSLSFLWIANSGEDTISKLDTSTGKEVGRYAVCADPSRTAVAKNGDGWSGCRGDGGVVHIRADVSKCPDSNGNGVIETSMDANGDGAISPDEQVPGDECVLTTTYPAGGGIVRAMGVDAEGFAWAGLWDERRLYRIDPTSGEAVTTIELPAKPYGLAIDKAGMVWVSAREDKLLLRVDPETKDVQSLAPSFGQCFEPYGIAIDESGSVWLANAWCWDVAWRYEPATAAWSYVETDNTPRGVAPDGHGHLYVANDDSNRVAKIDIATMQTVGYAELGAGRKPVGVGVAPDGFIWTVNQNSSSATKIDPSSLTVVHEREVGQSPYTYSDMTGQSHFDDLAPEGSYRATFGGWEGMKVQWRTLSVDYDAPEDTHVMLRVRTSTTAAKLTEADWSEPIGPFTDATFPVVLPPVVDAKHPLLEVEVSLYTSSETEKPFVKRVEVTVRSKPAAE